MIASEHAPYDGQDMNDGAQALGHLLDHSNSRCAIVLIITPPIVESHLRHTNALSRTHRRVSSGGKLAARNVNRMDMVLRLECSASAWTSANTCPFTVVLELARSAKSSGDKQSRPLRSFELYQLIVFVLDECLVGSK